MAKKKTKAQLKRQRERQKRKAAVEKQVHVVFSDVGVNESFSVEQRKRFPFLKTLTVYPSRRCYERGPETQVAFYLTPIEMAEWKPSVYAAKHNRFVEEEYQRLGIAHNQQALQQDQIKANLISRVFRVNYHFVPYLREFATPFGERQGDTFTEIAFFFFGEIIREGGEFKHVIAQGFVDRFDEARSKGTLHRSMAQAMKAVRGELWAPWIVEQDLKWLFPHFKHELSLSYDGEHQEDLEEGS